MPLTQTDVSSDARVSAEQSVRFADLGLSETVLRAVADMGYKEPTPVQAASIPEVLAGRDLLAAAQTGTGKTAAFLLPSLDKLGHVSPRKKGSERSRRAAARDARGRGPLMLVITPTRELAQQIERVCRAITKRTGHFAVTVVGGVSYNPQKSALRRGCDVLVATPGRLCDLIEQGAANLDEVGVLVLDEADRMLDMGFLPQVRQIVKNCPENRQTLLFSATLDEGRVGAITDLVKDPARVEIAPVTSTADTVDQYVLPVSTDCKNGALTQLLKKEGAERAIVFVRTKRRADTCARRLERAGITCGVIHGDRSQAQRERALRDFRAGRVQALVATDVLARGIDISDVRYVVNFDVPEEPTDYIHRIGRTGRAGEAGWSVTFVTNEDVDEFYDIEALMGKTADLYDGSGMSLGAPLPAVDPERVPAKKPAGKKARKRRRKNAKDGASKRAPKQRAPRSPRQRDIERRAAHEAAREAVAETGEKMASHPSSRKRPGKARVREEASRADRREGNGRNDARKQDRGNRDGQRRSPRHDERSARSSRGDRSASGRPGVRARDGWRNYDEAPSRDRRSGADRGSASRSSRGSNERDGRARGRNDRGGRGARPEGQRRSSSRRPGDRGGKRS